MSKEGGKTKGELNWDVEELVSRIETFPLTPAPRPPQLVVLEQDNNVEQSFRGKGRGFNMDFRVRRGRGDQRGGREINNAEVMEVM